MNARMQAPERGTLAKLTDLPSRANQFHAHVQRMGEPLRSEFKLPPVHQLGVMVPNVQKAAQDLEQLGYGSFFVAAGAPKFWRENGKERSISGALAMGYRDNIEMELLEPGINTNWYRDSLDEGGTYAIQHLGYMVEDVDAAATPLTRAGFQLKVRGQLSTLGLKCNFAYVDTRAAGGYITEFISLTVAGIHVAPAKVYRPLAGLQKLLRIKSFNL